jgi:hypothetical protein
MSLFESLKNRLQSTSRFAQIALAAECADRVYPIYEEYWIGSYYESVKQSIELARSLSLGDEIDEKVVQSSLTELQDLVEFYREEGIDILSATITVVLRVLQAINSSDDECLVAVTRCLISTLDTAQSAEAMANQSTPKNSRVKVAISQEKEWQDSALQIIDGWSGIANQNMFQTCGEKPPTWLLDWLERSQR